MCSVAVVLYCRSFEFWVFGVRFGTVFVFFGFVRFSEVWSAFGPRGPHWLVWCRWGGVGWAVYYTNYVAVVLLAAWYVPRLDWVGYEFYVKIGLVAVRHGWCILLAKVVLRFRLSGGHHTQYLGEDD